MSSKLLTQFRTMVKKLEPCNSGKRLMSSGGSVSEILQNATENQKWWFIYYAFAKCPARPFDGWRYSTDAIAWASANYTLAKKGTVLRKVLDIAKRKGVI